jgi:toxin ParE1/3/4
VNKLRFLPAAEAELLAEVRYYSSARSGLGLKFVHAVENAIKMALANPEGGLSCRKGNRRWPVKGFPFNVIYRASDIEVLVVAIVHHRRRPGYWLDRTP